MADHAAVTVTDPGALAFDVDIAVKETIGSLTGNGDVRVQLGTLTVGANNASTTFAGLFEGRRTQGGPQESPFRLVKIGTGTLTFAGFNAPDDQLVVDAGTLLVDGRSSGTRVLVRGGVLGGTGTLLGDSDRDTFNTIAVAGGAISPGQAQNPGILHGDAADLDQGGSLVVQLNGAAPGTGYDRLELTRGLTLGADARLVVTRAFEPPQGTAFTIVTVAPGHTIAGTFAGLPEGGTLTVDRQRFRITYRGGPEQNSLVLTALEDVPPPTYFLSEGATGGFFDEDVLIANPNDTAAPVTLTFSKENGEQVVATRTVPAQSRLTVHVDEIAGLEQTSASAHVTSDAKVPLVVERSMFWDRTYYAGHTGSAVDTPAADWFFAEGSQGSFFDTFVLVNNPHAAPADVTFTFFREREVPVVKTMTVGATTRLTLHAGAVPELVDRSFGIAVHAMQPIMAERAMYFGTTPTRVWSGGTESAGVTAASPRWFLAEGATGDFFDTFILLSNPQTTPAQVTLTYLLDTGETVAVTKTIPANTRLTTNIEAEADVRLHNAAVSTVVTSDVPIIAERSMYWPVRYSRGAKATTASASSRLARNGALPRGAPAGRSTSTRTSCSPIRRRRMRT